MLAKFKKVVNIVSIGFLSLAILLAILLVGTRIFGFTPYTVLSGSMEPRFPVGSVVYVRKIDPAELQTGDVITYVIDGGTVVTHRIIEIIPDEEDASVLRFRTKGDNNNITDGEPIHSNNILGKVAFCLPLLGYVSHYIQTPPWTYFVIAIVLMMLLLAFIPDLLEKALAEEKSDDGQTDEKKE